MEAAMQALVDRDSIMATEIETLNHMLRTTQRALQKQSYQSIRASQKAERERYSSYQLGPERYFEGTRMANPFSTAMPFLSDGKSTNIPLFIRHAQLEESLESPILAHPPREVLYVKERVHGSVMKYLQGSPGGISDVLAITHPKAIETPDVPKPQMSACRVCEEHIPKDEFASHMLRCVASKRWVYQMKHCDKQIMEVMDQAPGEAHLPCASTPIINLTSPEPDAMFEGLSSDEKAAVIHAWKALVDVSYRAAEVAVAAEDETKSSETPALVRLVEDSKQIPFLLDGISESPASRTLRTAVNRVQSLVRCVTWCCVCFFCVLFVFFCFNPARLLFAWF